MSSRGPQQFSLRQSFQLGCLIERTRAGCDEDVRGRNLAVVVTAWAGLRVRLWI